MTLFKEAHLNARCHGANKCSSCKYLGPCDSLTMFIRTDMIFVPIKTGTLLLYVFGKIRKFNKPSTHTWSLSKPLALREHWIQPKYGNDWPSAHSTCKIFDKGCSGVL